MAPAVLVHPYWGLSLESQFSAIGSSYTYSVLTETAHYVLSYPIC